MIKFTEDSLISKKLDLEIGKNRLKSLEKTLRILGNFNPKEDIEVTNTEYISEPYTFLYEITDLARTSFKFYNFAITDSGIYPNRYKMNYMLIMKRKDQKTEYTYEFSSQKGIKNLKLIEINYPISENRTFIIELSNKNVITLRLIEKDKKYIIELNDQKKDSNGEFILQRFEEIIKSLESQEVINLEVILEVIQNNNAINYVYIYKNEDLLADINFNKGQISNYKIVEPTKSIEVSINDTITRKVERKDIEPYIEKLTSDSEKYKAEYKRLLKRL